MQKEWKHRNPGNWVFSNMNTKRNQPMIIWFDESTQLGEDFENLCTAEEMEIYSYLSETKAAFAECTKRSLTKNLHSYMEEKGCKHIHNLPEFFTTLSIRRNCAINLIPEDVNNLDFLSILYSKPIRKFSGQSEQTQVQNWWQTLHLLARFSLQEGSQSTVYTKKLWNCCNCFQKTSNIHKKGWAG